MDTTKAVQGVAVYFEFARSMATTQVILVPDGYTSSDDLVPATIVRRTITKHSPKKQWKFSRLPNAEVSELLGDEDIAAYTEGRMKYASTLFDQLISGSWHLIKSPILIEASKKDYDSISTSKTPTKMIYRISQSRSALDFPDQLINTYE
jgi:hypothetical protein